MLIEGFWLVEPPAMLCILKGAIFLMNAAPFPLFQVAMKCFGKIFALLVVASVMVCASARLATAQGNATPNRAPKSWAVVIGINKYPKLPGGQQLMFADKDATAFAEAIKKTCGDNVRTFINQEATLSAIKEAVGNWLARSTIEGDTVYLFFSGHGIVENEYGESYLLAYDSDANLPYSSALSLRELSHAISSRVRAHQVLIIADAVRRDFFEPDTGGTATSTTFSRAFNQLVETRPGVAALLANGAGEYSREGQRWNAHSVFTKYLLDAFAGDADANRDGAITADELYNFVAPRVASDTSNRQHPSRSGNALAEIVMARNTTNLAAVKPAETAKPPAVVAKAETKESGKPAPVAKPEAAKSEPTNQRQLVAEVAKTPVAPPTEASKPPTQPPVEISKQAAPPAANKTTVVETKPLPKSEATKATPKSAEIASAPKSSEIKAAPKVVETLTPKPIATTTESKTAPVIAEPKPPEKTEPKPVEKSAPKPPERTAPKKPAPPSPPAIKTSQPVVSEGKVPVANGSLATAQPTPPVPIKTIPKPPSIGTISDASPKPQPTATASLPVTELTTAPSPLPSQFEMAIAAGRIVEPRGNNAWELYQQMNGQAATATDAARLKPRLIEALIQVGKETVSGDVRGDTISDRVDDFKRAGQLFAKGKSLAPENKDLPMLEKLSAAEALIALQFYDEAERALSQMPQSAASENASGILYTGKLDYWKAERAYKNAIEMEPSWFAPHYNLGLLYRAQKNEAAQAAFERAAALNEKSVAAWLALGDEHFSQNHWQQAAEAYRKAVALKPDDDSLHTKLGHALYSQGLRDDANREYQKAKELRGKQ
jgi:uncharacterized caspase-like protein/Flp pilus assembly protein TadD